jgi:hypothetical protein
MICSDLRASLMIDKGRRSPCECGPGRERCKEARARQERKQRQGRRTERQAVKAEQANGIGGVEDKLRAAQIMTRHLIVPDRTATRIANPETTAYR